MKRKEDKENIDEAKEYSKKLDSDIQKAILRWCADSFLGS
jgi:hypothetical protein